MSAPTPAQPSEGANFYRFGDLPDDGTWDARICGVWRVIQNKELWPFEYTMDEDVVEARPKPAPLVAVMLPKDVVERYARAQGWVHDESAFLVPACRKALESDS